MSSVKVETSFVLSRKQVSGLPQWRDRGQSIEESSEFGAIYFVSSSVY